MKTFDNPDVARVFAAYPTNVRAKLIILRELIFDVASKTDTVGEIEEALKWGQPSYLTKPKTGTTIRIDQMEHRSDDYGVYVSCQTTLIDTFKQIYPQEFEYLSNCGIRLSVRDEVPIDKLRHVIALALTYHLDKRSSGSRKR